MARQYQIMCYCIDYILDVLIYILSDVCKEKKIEYLRSILWIALTYYTIWNIFHDNEMRKMYGSDNDAKYITIRKGAIFIQKKMPKKVFWMKEALFSLIETYDSG